MQDKAEGYVPISVSLFLPILALNLSKITKTQMAKLEMQIDHIIYNVLLMICKTDLKIEWKRAIT